MTDAEYAEMKERLEKMLSKWHPLLQMGWHTLKYKYVRGYDEDDSVCAVTKASWTYRRGYITWYMQKLYELNEDELENIVVHEFCHILLAPVTQDQPENWREQIELTTETMAVILINLHRGENAGNGPNVSIGEETDRPILPTDKHTLA